MINFLLDPHYLGKTPKDLNIIVKDNKWKELENLTDPKAYEEAERIKNLFAKKIINAMVGGERSLRPETRTTPTTITRKFIQHCLQVTQSSIDFMENNPGKKLPVDYVNYPGKMDHTTAVSFLIGEKQLAKDTPSGESTSPWQIFTTETGEKYFYNSITGESSWEDPWLKVEEWKAFYDEEGELYYYNTKTGQTSWEAPAEVKKKLAQKDGK
jgi:hypothetical protein